MRIQKGRLRGLVTAMPASALVLLGAGCSKTEATELSTQGIYAVLEVTPLRGTASEEGRAGPVRVMVVDPRIDAPAGKQLEAEGFPTDCPVAPSPCDSVALERGGLVLRALGTHVLDPGALASWEVGDERVVRGTQLSFTTLDRGPILTLSGPEVAPAEARVKLLKKCEVRIVQVKHASSESGIRGVFSSSKPAPRSWVEVARPRCFEGLDRYAEFPSAEGMARQKAEDMRQKAGREPHLAPLAEHEEKKAEAHAFREERRASIERAANEWAEKHPPESTGWEALSPLERKLNPKAASLMHAGQLATLSFDFRCLKRRSRTSTKPLFSSSSRRGSGCKHSGHVLVVEWSGGVRMGVNRSSRETGAWTEDSTASTLAELFERVWLDENGWLRLERPQRFERPLRSWVTEPPEEKVIDELQEMLTFLAVHVPPPGDPAHERLPRPETWSFMSPGSDEDE